MGILDSMLLSKKYCTQHGYAEVYPNKFGENKNSEIAKAMDEARGGYFKNVPNSYPSIAWYTYDDKTCNYSCQITEYTYWTLTSILAVSYTHLTLPTTVIV